MVARFRSIPKRRLPPRPIANRTPRPRQENLGRIRRPRLNSSVNSPGQQFRASIAAPVWVGSEAVVYKGADARVRLELVQNAGRLAGQSELQVRLVSFNARGTVYNVATNLIDEKGSSRGKNSAAKVGGGAAVGAVIGGILAKGKGAAMGAVAGGGTMAGVQFATHGAIVRIPSETLLIFTLSKPLTVTFSQ
jgi:hypothetical protein